MIKDNQLKILNIHFQHLKNYPAVSRCYRLHAIALALAPPALDVSGVPGYLEGMENFVDIATPAELEGYFGYAPSEKEVARLRSVCGNDTDFNFSNLACLFHDRGQREQADHYLEQIQDNERKLETTMSLYECRIP